jgi:hypothetical protein
VHRAGLAAASLLLAVTRFAATSLKHPAASCAPLLLLLLLLLGSPALQASCPWFVRQLRL